MPLIIKNTHQVTTTPHPILFVNYHGSVGGGQVHLLTIIDGLDKSRFAPQVVCCQEGKFLPLLKERNIEPILIPFKKAKWRNLHYSIPALWKFYKLLKKQKFKLVHVSGLQEAKLAAYPCSWANIPMVWLVAP